MFNPKALLSISAASLVGYTFEPKFPGGDGIGATITVRGPESEPVKRLVREQLAQAQARELAARKRGRDPEPLTLDEMRNQAIDLAVAYTIGWDGFMDGDTPLEPLEANLRAVYTDHSWLRRQVIEEAQDLGNFVQRTGKPSSNTLAPSSGST